MDLSLKYRPKKFEEVVYQPHVIKSITGALEHKDSSFLYLFSGPQGVGKTSVARLIAMFFSCLSEKEKPCGECDNCITINSGGNFPDVYEINAAQYTKKDDAETTILNTVNYQPLQSSKKIYILDECHQFSKAAQQSLLKIFEEPPKDIIFILCTTEPNKVLPTIKDRALHFEFKYIPAKLIFNHLKGIIKKEEINISDDILWLLVKEANGSLRKPYKLLKNIKSANMTSDDLKLLIGQIDTSAAIEILENVVMSKQGAVLQNVMDIINNGKDIKYLFQEIMECLVDILKIKTISNIDIDRSDIISEKLTEISQEFTKGKQIIKMIEILEEGVSEINQSLASDHVIGTTTTIKLLSAFHNNK